MSLDLCVIAIESFLSIEIIPVLSVGLTKFDCRSRKLD